MCVRWSAAHEKMSCLWLLIICLRNLRTLIVGLTRCSQTQAIKFKHLAKRILHVQNLSRPAVIWPRHRRCRYRGLLGPGLEAPIFLTRRGRRVPGCKCRLVVLSIVGRRGNSKELLQSLTRVNRRLLRLGLRLGCFGRLSRWICRLRIRASCPEAL